MTDDTSIRRRTQGKQQKHGSDQAQEGAPGGYVSAHLVSPRAMTKQAEAEWEKRAEVIGSQPATLQLRSLQKLTEIAGEKNATILFPLPIDLIVPLTQILHHQANVPVQAPVNTSRRSQREESELCQRSGWRNRGLKSLEPLWLSMRSMSV